MYSGWLLPLLLPLLLLLHHFRDKCLWRQRTACSVANSTFRRKERPGPRCGWLWPGRSLWCCTCRAADRWTYSRSNGGMFQSAFTRQASLSALRGHLLSGVNLTSDLPPPPRACAFCSAFRPAHIYWFIVPQAFVSELPTDLSSCVSTTASAQYRLKSSL